LRVRTTATSFADVLSKADYAKVRFVITKHGRRAAALIPIEEYGLLQRVPEKLECQDNVKARLGTRSGSRSAYLNSILVNGAG